MGIIDKLLGRTNTDRGTEAEDVVKARYEMDGAEVTRTGRGSDWHVRYRSPLTGRVEKSFKVEVKRNNSRPSRLQKSSKNTRVIRVKDDILGSPSNIYREDMRGNRYETDMFGRTRRVSKRQSEDPFGLNSMFGSSSGRSRRRKDDDPFGVNSMFGGSTGKRRRRKSDPFDIGF